MARAKRKPKLQRHIVQAAIDATPERLAKGDMCDFVNPAEIDDTEQPIGRVRRFKASMLDRLYHNGKLTWSQFYAGDQYRNAYHRAGFALSVVASYGGSKAMRNIAQIRRALDDMARYLKLP